MELKKAANVAYSFDYLRGLAHVQEIYNLRPGVLIAQEPTLRGAVPLKPGEETPVVATLSLSDLPANANVRSVTATLDVSAEPGEPATAQTACTVQLNDQAADSITVETAVPVRPSNVSVRLDGGEPIWTFGGLLSNDSYPLPDFASQLNAYLERVVPEGDKLPLRFLVKSATPGRVLIRPSSPRYSLLQTESWPNPLDDTVRLDRNLMLDFGMLARIPLQGISPAGRQVRHTSLRLAVDGQFGPERLLGPLEMHDGRQYATISTDYSLAQAFTLEAGGSAMSVTGIAAWLDLPEAAEVYIELQGDADGGPASGSPLARVEKPLQLAAAEAAGWVYMGFVSPVEVRPATRYWIVVKGVRGAARLGLRAGRSGYLGDARINRGGQLWKPFHRAADAGSGLSAMLRVVYLPGLDNQAAAVEVAVEGPEVVQRLDAVSTATALAFDLGGTPTAATALVIRSRGRGTLRLANVVQEYERV